MSEKKYRACLIGMLAVMLIIGATIYIKNHRNDEIPTEGTLVKNQVERMVDRDGGTNWAQEMKYYI